MFNKKQARLRRARKTRAKIAELKAVRLCINRTNCHIYAQIISPCGGKVLASASTLDKNVRDDVSNGGNKAAATAVGKLIAERAKVQSLAAQLADRLEPRDALEDEAEGEHDVGDGQRAELLGRLRRRPSPRPQPAARNLPRGALGRERADCGGRRGRRDDVDLGEGRVEVALDERAHKIKSWRCF